MKKIKLFLCGLAAVICVGSCIEKPQEQEQFTPMTVGAYVLNSGNYGGNDASLTMVNTLSSTLYADAFYRNNEKRLGDTGQDIMTYGNNMFIALSGSGIIYVVDKFTCLLKAEIKPEIPEEGIATMSPRYFAAHDGAVYVSLYEGYVGKIDTTTMKLNNYLKVGDNPEGLAVAGGKLYVANSGGMAYPNYGNTVSVVNLNTFEVTNTIAVAENPNVLKAVSDNVYLISWGNYDDNPAMLQRIDSGSDAVTNITAVKDPYLMEVDKDGNLIVVTSSYDASWNPVQDIVVYNTKFDVLDGRFISDGFGLSSIYSLSVDTFTGYVYVGTSDYVSTGMVYIFTRDGEIMTSFSSAGYNPIKVAFVTNF